MKALRVAPSTARKSLFTGLCVQAASRDRASLPYPCSARLVEFGDDEGLSCLLRIEARLSLFSLVA
jgi:hypothetical protein